MTPFARPVRRRLMGGVAAIAMLSCSAAYAADARFDIGPQPLDSALREFGVQSGVAIMADADVTFAKRSPGFSATADAETALRQLLNGTGLSFKRQGDVFVVARLGEDGSPQSASVAGGGAEVEALIVTAQKKEEAIQDVPIAISAFTATALEEQKIEGGFDLLKAIPNVTFSKNNFTSYNFSIRGIGTKAVSATTDPGVSVSFNNAGLIQNRLFEQEYFDVERVEVLRGPQGTLYGRNATAGVINVISAKPDMDEFKGSIKGEVGNYHSKRLVTMLNIPLIEDKLAVRFAGSLTSRQGYDFNDTTKNAVNGRELWSGRVTLAFNPTDRLSTSLLWERFNEDDNRSRTGKQLCKRDPGLTQVGSSPVGAGPITQSLFAGIVFSQGCSPVSLYDDAAFQTPNGHALPFVAALQFFGGGCVADEMPGFSDAPMYIGYDRPDTSDPDAERPRVVGLLNCSDPYGQMKQTKDLRVINSFRDPVYRAKAGVVQLETRFDLTDNLELISQTTYNKDEVYSFQDFNRFNTLPIFNDTSGLYCGLRACFDSEDEPSPWRSLAPGGVYCDPQLGCSNTMAGFDISSATSTQFGQEFRVQSDFNGPINFSVGANYTRFKVLVDYYVFFNVITAFAQAPPFNLQADMTKCNIAPGLFFPEIDPPAENGAPVTGCPYIDPNPVESINGEGHNYFRSKNPYNLSSTAVFGEVYWQLSDGLKITAGLRYTDDRKAFTPVPTQILLADSHFNAGDVARGYPEEPDIKQHWGEFTGRLGVDWKPALSFTEQTMIYAFYSRGYKGGGANPPGVGFTKRSQAERLLGFPPGELCGCFFDNPPLTQVAQNSTATFKPEFVNALEVGAKNTLLSGGLIFNTAAFVYDYKDYQVSKIVDRTASNENFDAIVWGLEFETVFSPTRNLRFIGNLGYLDTRIGSGAESIDIMNRTQGNDDWVLIRPWVQLPSNCIVPKSMAEAELNTQEYGLGYPAGFNSWCGGLYIPLVASVPPIDPITGLTYDPLYYDGTNGRPNIHGGAGFTQNLQGNELPNSPHWTVNAGAQYGWDLLEGWRATVRGDAYWQSQSWARVYNAVNDKLHGWYNVNLSLWLENEDGLKIEVYAKNVLDKTPITDSFVNSDDTALTTNVFVLDPRLIGLSIRKEF